MRYLIFNLILAAFLFGCAAGDTNDTTATTKSLVTVKGKIINPKGDKITFSQQAAPEVEPLKVITKVAEDGTFSTEFELDAPSYFRISHEEYTTVYLTPGDDLTLSLDTEKFDESIQYEGKGSVANNYIKDKYMLEEGFGSNEEIFSLEMEDFTNKINEMSSVYSERLAKVSEQGGSEDFIKLAEREILYDRANKQLNYKEYHEYYMDGHTVDKEDESYKKEVNMNDGNLMGLAAYRSFISNYLNKEYGKTQDMDHDEAQSAMSKYNLAGKLFSDKSILSFLKTRILNNYIKYNGVAGVEPLMDAFKKDVSQPYLVQQVSNSYDKWKDLAPGKPARDFVARNMDGKEIKLSDLKGKLVYVDVWATWCGPCKREIPHLEKLHHAYSGKAIEFVSVSIDENKEAWEKMVKDKNLVGTQLHIDGAWESTITKDYNINGIPRFMLFDKDGNIVDANAERPSGKIKESFDGLLTSI